MKDMEIKSLKREVGALRTVLADYLSPNQIETALAYTGFDRELELQLKRRSA